MSEVHAIVDSLERKHKFQKAANLLYGAVVADSNNQQLRHRWSELIKEANMQEAGEQGCMVSSLRFLPSSSPL